MLLNSISRYYKFRVFETSPRRFGSMSGRCRGLGGSDAAEGIRAAKPDAQGWRIATIWIESVQHAAGLLLLFNSDVEILSPENLRRELAMRARRVTALYTQPGQASG